MIEDIKIGDATIEVRDVKSVWNCIKKAFKSIFKKKKKKVTATLLILLSSVAFAGDKCYLLNSPLGGIFSLKGGPGLNHCVNKDGTLDSKKVEAMAEYISNTGANAMREFIWIDSQEAAAAIDINSPLFFQNMSNVVDIVNSKGITFFWSLFDECGAKSPQGKFNPWAKFGETFFYGENAKEARHLYLSKILDSFRLPGGWKAVCLDVCNEPRAGCGEFVTDTIAYLINAGFPPERISIGFDYYGREKGNDGTAQDYIYVRENLPKRLGQKWKAEWLKEVCLSPIHNTTINLVNSLLNDYPGNWLRPVIFSTDGRQPRPSKDEYNQVAKKIFSGYKTPALDGRINLEGVFGKTPGDPLDNFLGFSEAYREFFGKYPANYGKYPTAVWPYVGKSDIPTQPVDPLSLLNAEVVRIKEELQLRVLWLEGKVKELENRLNSHRLIKGRL